MHLVGLPEEEKLRWAIRRANVHELFCRDKFDAVELVKFDCADLPLRRLQLVEDLEVVSEARIGCCDRDRVGRLYFAIELRLSGRRRLIREVRSVLGSDSRIGNRSQDSY